MKKILTASMIVVLLAAFSVGAVMAEDEPPTTPTTQNGQYKRGNSRNSVLVEYTNQAIAELLGISIEEYDAYRENGVSLFEIAEELGIDARTLATLRNDARAMAYEAAQADGVLADRAYQNFQSRIGNGQGGWRQGGRGTRTGNGGGQGGGGIIGNGPCNGTGECDCTGILEPTN